MSEFGGKIRSSGARLYSVVLVVCCIAGLGVRNVTPTIKAASVGVESGGVVGRATACLGTACPSLFWFEGVWGGKMVCELNWTLRQL